MKYIKLSSTVENKQAKDTVFHLFLALKAKIRHYCRKFQMGKFVKLKNIPYKNVFWIVIFISLVWLQIEYIVINFEAITVNVMLCSTLNTYG